MRNPYNMKAIRVSLRVLAAGSAYFLVVFAAGFVLGTLRNLLVAPQVGEVAAAVLEVPVMLAISWFVCGWVLEKIHVAPRTMDRLVMGAIALGLLLLAEALVSVGLADVSLSEHFRSYSRPAPRIGLAAQLLYACFPLIRGGPEESA
jgi:hypothetical protein